MSRSCTQLLLGSTVTAGNTILIHSVRLRRRLEEDVALDVIGHTLTSTQCWAASDGFLGLWYWQKIVFSDESRFYY